MLKRVKVHILSSQTKLVSQAFNEMRHKIDMLPVELITVQIPCRFKMGQVLQLILKQGLKYWDRYL